MVERLEFQVGSLDFPMPDSLRGASLLESCDPALAKLIDYLSFQIDNKLGRILTNAVNPGTPPIAFNIAKKMSVDPRSHVRSFDQIKFPLFAIWRDKSLMSGRTLNWRQDVHTMEFLYTLPPMTLEWSEKFAHVLHAVAAIIMQTLHVGHDPQYNNDERVVGGNEIGSAKMLECAYEPYHLADQTSTVINALRGRLEVSELSMPHTSNLTPLELTEITITQQDDEDDVTPPITMIVADTDVG